MQDTTQPCTGLKCALPVGHVLLSQAEVDKSGIPTVARNYEHFGRFHQPTSIIAYQVQVMTLIFANPIDSLKSETYLISCTGSGNAIAAMP